MGECGNTEFVPNDFRNVTGATVLFSRLEQKEFVVKIGRGKYSIFHPLFLSYLRSKSRLDD